VSRDAIEEIRRRTAGRRVFVIGVGALDRGDDGFGPALVRALAARGFPRGWSAVDAGLAPENAIGRAAREAPEVVIFADAAAMGAEPGTIALLSADAASEMAPSTHGISIAALAEWLRLTVAADTLLVAVEPKRLGPSETRDPFIPRTDSLSNEVAGALAAVVDALVGTD